MSDEMDPVDAAFLESFREPAIEATGGFGMPGFFAIVNWINDEGEMKMRYYNQLDLPSTQVIGLLEMAKLHVIASADTGLPIRYPEDDS